MLTGPYEKYKRSSRASHFAFFQPGLAWLGLVSTMSIVLFFNSASMWQGQLIGTKVITAYLSVGRDTRSIEKLRRTDLEFNTARHHLIHVACPKAPPKPLRPPMGRLP
jgi:hypothetical protein